jgi:hypothetical protein
MANKLQVQIQETVEELEHRLERAITAVIPIHYEGTLNIG